MGPLRASCTSTTVCAPGRADPMRRADNRHSRLVALARVVLPLAALALFATLFLFARQIDPNRAVSLSEVDVQAVAREARIGAPVYSGLTEDGSDLRFEAASARPDPAVPGRMTATAPQVTLQSPAGDVTRARSEAASFDSATGGLVLEGAVHLQVPGGWQMTSDRLEGSLRMGTWASPGPIQAEGPGGQLQAGAMRVGPSGTDPAAATDDVVFSGGVKLLYDPG